MRIFLTFLMAIFLINNANAQINWEKISSGTSYNLFDVCYPENEYDAYFCGDNGYFSKTSDGGNHIEIFKVREFSYQKESIKLTYIKSNLKNSFITLGYYKSTYHTHIGCMKSENSGDTIYHFSLPECPWDNTNKSIKFCFPISVSIGYYSIVKKDSYGKLNTHIFKSENSGNSWTELYILNSFQANSINFINNNIGFIVGNEGIIYKTTNSGLNWSLINISSSLKKKFNYIGFKNRSNLDEWFILGDEGRILQTTDRGENWKLVNSNVVSNLVSFKFSENKKIGIIVGEEGKILTSTDEGETWSVYTHPSGENLNAISIPPNQDKVAFIVGSNGLILKASNLDIVGVKENEYFNLDFSISPNPATDNISISFSNSELTNSSISIFNSLGMEMYQKPFEGSVLNISTEDFPSGIYYCTLNTGKERITKSFVVIK